MIFRLVFASSAIMSDIDASTSFKIKSFVCLVHFTSNNATIIAKGGGFVAANRDKQIPNVQVLKCSCYRGKQIQNCKLQKLTIEKFYTFLWLKLMQRLISGQQQTSCPKNRHWENK